jgi:hypothetical protein
MQASYEGSRTPPNKEVKVKVQVGVLGGGCDDIMEMEDGGWSGEVMRPRDECDINQHNNIMGSCDC